MRMMVEPHKKLVSYENSVGKSCCCHLSTYGTVYVRGRSRVEGGRV